MRVVIALAMLLTSAGCETFAPKAVEQGSVIQTRQGDKVVTENRSDYATYVAAKQNPAKLFEFKCPPSGCNFVEFVAYQTGGGGDIPPPPKTEAPQHPVVGFMREVKETLLGVAPIVLGIQGFKYFSHSVDSVANIANNVANNSHPISTVFVSGSGNSAAVGGSANSSNPTSMTQTITTNTTTTSTSNSNNRSATGGSTTTGDGGPATN